MSGFETDVQNAETAKFDNARMPGHPKTLGLVWSTIRVEKGQFLVPESWFPKA